MKHLLAATLLALAAASAFAQSGASADPPAGAPQATPAAAAAPASAEPAAAPAAAPAAGPAGDAQAAAEERPFRVPAGWREKKYKGETVYCRKQTATGSRFADEKCLSKEALHRYTVDNEDNARRVQQNVRMCVTAGVCAPQ